MTALTISVPIRAKEESKPFLVGFGNKARHGKNFVADEVHALLPRETRLYSFATALKAFARVFGMREKDGSILQALGTNVFRKVDPDIWVRVLKYQIEEENPKCALITDVRFPNEANYIRNSGGLLVRVSRTRGLSEHNPLGLIGIWNQLRARLDSPNPFRKPKVIVPWVSPDRDPNHPSETALDDYPFDICLTALSGDLDTLKQGAKTVALAITRALEPTHKFTLEEK